MQHDEDIYLDLMIEESHFLFSVAEVQEVAELPPIHPYPIAYKGLFGVVNLRGQVIPVVSMSSEEALSYSRLIVTRVNDVLLAFPCESVKKVVLKDEQLSEIRSSKMTTVDGKPAELLTADIILKRCLS